MKRVSAHLSKDSKFKVSDIEHEFSESPYRILFMGEHLDVFIPTEIEEAFFDELDKKLHKKTYLQLQEEIFNLECDLEKANELLEMYQDNVS
jgi:hypothetical protein